MESDAVEEENEENNEIENKEEYSERCMHYRTVWSWLLGCSSITTSSPPSMPHVPSYDDSGISGLAIVLEDGGVGTDGGRLMGEGLVQIGEEDIKRIVDIREGDIKGEEDGEGKGYKRWVKDEIRRRRNQEKEREEQEVIKERGRGKVLDYERPLLELFFTSMRPDYRL
ncbi:hypothetical protein TrCOL_g10008 [Triparma columacea]|uniref:Uncharacterized protein n=1 Tax=Triparma columacea TaxID=722753 RepID=A0A9W7GGK7_9STRA|nr:hypothetical protein TrCOL_g10008 [Triparma columacea]